VGCTRCTKQIHPSTGSYMAHQHTWQTYCNLITLWWCNTHQLLYLVLYRALYYQVTILIGNSIVLWAGTCCIEHFTTRWQYLLTHSSIVLWAVLVCRFPGSVHAALPQISRWRFYLETRTEMLYLQLFMRSWFLQGKRAYYWFGNNVKKGLYHHLLTQVYNTCSETHREGERSSSAWSCAHTRPYTIIGMR